MSPICNRERQRPKFEFDTDNARESDIDPQTTVDNAFRSRLAGVERKPVSIMVPAADHDKPSMD